MSMFPTPVAAEMILPVSDRRYDLDPVHHARVEVVIRLIDRDLYDRTGCHMDDHDRSLALMAASAGLTAAGLMPERLL